ncbi:MAG: DnaD domain protein [Pseudoramibacter sp.]
MDNQHSTKFVFDQAYENYGITPVENVFINVYMPQANGDYVKVYLYGLKQCFSKAAVPVDNELLSEELHITEGDVRKAWDYWQKQGILSVHYNDSGRAEVRYFSIPARLLNPHKEPPAVNAVNAEDAAPETEQESRVKGMFDKIEEMFKSPLSLTTLSTLSGYLKDYQFEPETVVLLAEYAMNNIAGKGTAFTQKQTCRYMDRVADSWHDAGVVTYEDAEVYIAESKTRQKRYYKILNELGQHRSPMGSERRLIDKWFDTYHFKPEIIKAALNRTSKPNLKYVDGILTQWHQKGITTLEGVEKEGEAFRQAARSKAPEAPAAADSDLKEREDLIDALADQDTQSLWRLIDENEQENSNPSGRH